MPPDPPPTDPPPSDPPPTDPPPTDPPATLLGAPSPKPGDPPPTDPPPTDPPPPADVVPETYADFTVPEGMTLNEGMLASFQTAAKDMKLTQERAQGIIDMGMQLVQETQAANTAAYEQQNKDWEAETRAHPDIKGPSGDRADLNIGIANQAVMVIGGEPLKKALNLTGAGTHVEVVRAFLRFGKAMQEDNWAVPGETGAVKVKSPAEILYPNMVTRH